VQRTLDRAGLVGAEAGIEVGRLHAGLDQGADLVLHQRDQRRHHDRRALAQQRGDLVAQRLAAAGGHQHQRVAAGRDLLDDGLLLAAEGGIAEDVFEDVQRAAGLGRGGRRHGGRRGERSVHGAYCTGFTVLAWWRARSIS